MKKKDELLHQFVYRETFNKRARDKADMVRVRHDLEQARLFVMSDDMCVFLTNMLIDSFEPIYASKLSAKRRYKRAAELYDTVRHFSRLPHRITWVEMSLAPFLHVLKDRGRQPSKDEQECIDQGMREGWMLKQHPQIETAFRGRHFCNLDGGVSFRPFELTWDSEENQVPWASPKLGRIMIGEKDFREITPSEALTNFAGYVRPSIGLIWSGITSLPESLEERNKYIPAGSTFARLVWLFLSTVNKIPIVGETEVRISKGFFAQGRIRSFLTHKVLTLNVPKKADVRKMALRALVSLRRAHMVRGHWRDDWRLPPGNKSIWVGEHQRGDASKGLVIHDYKVEHEVR